MVFCLGGSSICFAKELVQKKSSSKDELVLSVREPAWVPSRKEMSLQIFRTRTKNGNSYRLDVKRSGEETRVRVLSEAEFNRARDKFMAVILKQEARRAPSAEKCQAASYQINLPFVHENGSICAGDYRGYFEAQAMVSELIRR